MKLETIRDRLNMVLANYPNDTKITGVDITSITVEGEYLQIETVDPA
jgi:hypothetical protein